MNKPDRLAWFFHRGQGERRLGVYDPDLGHFMDRGPVDELAALANGRLQDRDWLLDGAEPMGPSDSVAPVFDIPVRHPSKILCLGKNYAAHAAEFGAEVHEEPIFFTKFADTMTPHGAPIVLPHWVDTRIDHEIELGVILGFDDPDGRGRKYVSRESAIRIPPGWA